MKKIICISIIVLFAFRMYGQADIKGRVLETGGKPLEYATVALYNAGDSMLCRGTVTGADGRFVLEKINRGKYFITVSMIGFEKVSHEIAVINTQTHTVQDITLGESAHALKEVTVSATRNFVEQQADKMVINPEASVTAASDDALEVLSKSPGVVIDKDNNITLKNKQVKVMIDGRPTYLSGEQLAAMLRNMQATSVDRIEIIENPSSRYDAEGDGGIINIRTKRGLMRGYNGSLTLGAGAGKHFSGNYGIDLNYRNEKWNVYGNYYGGRRRGWNNIELTRRFLQSDSSLYRQYSEERWNSDYHNAKLGVDYYITPNQVVGIMARGNFGKNASDAGGDAHIFDAGGKEIQRTHTDDANDGDWRNLQVNMNYKWTVDTLGRELTIDADMARYRSDNMTDMSTSYIPPQTPLVMHKEQGGTSGFYSFKADYVLPLNDKTKIETGIKMSKAKIDNDLNFRQRDENGNWGDPNRMSNRFVYSENINAAYLSGRYTMNDKTSVQLGLRGEYTVSDGENATNEQRNERDYFNLFPSFFAQQKFNDKHQFGLSYSYRIGRPPYWLLNPFVWLLDPYTYNKGNPFLDPQFAHSAKLSYTLKNKYIFSVDYGYTKDSWMQVLEQDDATRTTIITWKNLNNFYNASMTAVLPIKITKRWNTDTNLTGYYGQYKSPFGEGEIDQTRFTFRGNTTFTFTLPKDFTVELSGRYMSKSIYGMLNMNARGSVDVGMQKQFFDKKATLKLSVSDVFATQKFRYTAQYENINLAGCENYDSRRANLTFTWRFGRTDIKAARQRSTGLEEETSRAGK